MSKEEKQRRYYVSYHGLKVNGDMLTAKISTADFVRLVFYSMTLQQMYQQMQQLF